MENGIRASVMGRSFWRHGMSLTLKALLLTVSVGVIFWVILNNFQTQTQKQIFNEYLLEELTKRTHYDWERFDDHMQAQLRVGKLLVTSNYFIEHVSALEKQNWADDVNFEIKRTVSKQPAWLPKRSTIRGIVRATHFLLLDPKGRVREMFQVGNNKLPDSLLTGLADDMVGIASRNIIREADGLPFLFSRISLWDSQRQSRAILVLVTSFDDGFLLTLQMQNKSEGVLVFLGNEGTVVVASSRPDLVATGTLVKDLEKEYLMMEKSYFDYGFSSEIFVQFASLIPVSRIQSLHETISKAGRTQRAVAHFVMIFLTVMIVVWLVGHIKDFTAEMLRFSKEQLGLDPEKAEGGDQLQVMKDQFKLLAGEITSTRKRELEREEELQSANKALWESLVMVKRTQSQLVESEKMAALGGLVAGVAHEINTPVGIGITAASFLQRRCAESAKLLNEGALKKSELDAYFAEAVESSEMILANLNRAAQQIRSFKQVAVDQTSEDRRCFNLKQYIDQVLLSLHYRIRRTNHTVTVSCPVDLECDGYPGVLSQIITNFIENSLIHGFSEKDHGKMSINIGMVENNIEFRYKDDGSGMVEQERKQVFGNYSIMAGNHTTITKQVPHCE